MIIVIIWDLQQWLSESSQIRYPNLHYYSITWTKQARLGIKWRLMLYQWPFRLLSRKCQYFNYLQLHKKASQSFKFSELWVPNMLSLSAALFVQDIVHCICHISWWIELAPCSRWSLKCLSKSVGEVRGLKNGV